MKSRRMVLWSAALLAAACGLAAAPLLSSVSAAPMVEVPLYGWTDKDPVNSNWVDEDNWQGPSGYPSLTVDAADFPFSAGTIWAVDLTTDETIGSLAIRNSVDFNGDSGTPTLTVNSLFLDAADGAITVTFNDDMKLIANKP